MSDMATDDGAHSLSEAASRSPRFFDSSLFCDHLMVQTVVENVVAYHEHKASPGRLRKRRKADKEAFNAIAHSLMANVAYALVDGKGPPTIAVSLAKPKAARSRYDSKGMGQLASVLEMLADGGARLIILRKSRRKGVASTIEPSQSLKDMMDPFRQFSLRDFHWEPVELIHLTHIEHDHAANTRTTERIDYEDTADTFRMRREVEAINASLGSAHLGFKNDGGLPVELRKTNLRRIFNTPNNGEHCFDFGGRLYGGWWQSMERERRHNIRIDGERVADLDFSAAFLRLAYNRLGIAPPSDDDLYEGILQDDQGGRYRDGVKQVVNAMLFRDKPLTRLPKGSAASLPPGCKGAELRAGILRRHPNLIGVFETGVGLSLMKAESDLMVAILLRLIDAGIIALPMHDGLMVRHDEAETAAAIMGDEAERLTGCRLPVKTSLL